MRVAAVSPGVGNVRSVLRALDRTITGPKEIVLTVDPDEIHRSDVLVVPGQGSFGVFAAALEGGLREALVERIAAGVPYLGICLGLQILFDESDEAPGARGLGVLRGRVRRLEPGFDEAAGRALALPHVGWNEARPRTEGGPLGTGHYYFAHTYAAAPEDERVIHATTTYGMPFTSAVWKDQIFGVQFHPEKSQRAGLALLERFFASLRSR